MGISVDVAWKSLNKHHEELCGDKVEVLKTADSDIVILADGMGSGVKANILATLTSKILGTMLFNGATIESCVETIAKTLPVCKVREVAYATFSILQIFGMEKHIWWNLTIQAVFLSGIIKYSLIHTRSGI